MLSKLIKICLYISALLGTAWSVKHMLWAVRIMINVYRSVLSCVWSIRTFMKLTFLRAVAPLIRERARFITLFTPISLPWHHPKCVGERMPNIPFIQKLLVKWGYAEMGGLASRSSDEYLIERLDNYLRDSDYHYRVCVTFVTVNDVLLFLLFLLLLAFVGWITIMTISGKLGFLDFMGRLVPSRCIAWFMSVTKQPLLNVSVVRKTFTSTEGVKLKKTKNHTHPQAASIRSASSATIQLICGLLGVPAYFVQKSKADVRKGRVGSRTYHWGKDVGVLPCEFNPPKDCVVALVDVDHYLDMPHLLAAYPHTYMISTFQPRVVAAECGEYSFTFDRENRIDYKVSGGANYNHRIWNYAGDIYTVSARIWFGLGVRTTVYNIDRRQIGPHHQIICLTPSKTFVTPIFNLSWLLPSDTLRYYDVVKGEFLRMTIKEPVGTKISTGRVGRLASATVSAVDDDTIASQVRIGRVALSIAQVKTVIEGISAEQATMLVEYHRQSIDDVACTVYPVEESVRNYQFDPPSYDPEAKVGVVPFMNPFVDGCYAPVNHKSNDQATVQGRILDVKPDDNLEFTDFDLTVMNEFVERLIPECNVGKGFPVDIDTVYEHQNRASQRSILERAVMAVKTTVNDFIQSFQKAETYADVKDPRNISTIPGVNKLNYSQFQYKFSEDVLKKQPWYAFGLTPLQIAHRVVAICKHALSACKTDLSRFDGRVSKLLRAFERLVMMRWVSDTYKNVLNELMMTQHSRNGVTKHGVRYNTGFSRLSGSPETSGFNTLDDAFMAYRALRCTRVNGVFLTADQAWERLGIYGGDDGLTADVDPDSYVKSCASLGQKLTICEVRRGEAGISFLSREYSSGVWFGSPDSMCDVKRQITKLHVTPHLPPNVTPLMKFTEKMSGFYMTDRNTPIIGELACLAISFDGVKENVNGLANYFSKYPENEQYPNRNEMDWMTHRVSEELPDFDFKSFAIWVKKVEVQEANVLEPPIFTPAAVELPKVARPVVVNGVVLVPEEKPLPPKPVLTGEGVDMALCVHECSFGEDCFHAKGVKAGLRKCYGLECNFTHVKAPKKTAGAGDKVQEASTPPQ